MKFDAEKVCRMMREEIEWNMEQQKKEILKEFDNVVDISERRTQQNGDDCA